MLHTFKTALLTISLFLGGLAPALANVQTFNLTWSGASFGNGASATGYISFDTALLNNPGYTGFSDMTGVSALSISVTGSSYGGNGTFGLSDYDVFQVNTGGGTLDLNSQWIGQAIPGVGTWGVNGGAFFLRSSSIDAPTGRGGAKLVTSGSEMMSLTSVAPVPEPETYAMLLFGLGLIGGIARRRKTNQA
jgi:hypothetical protein